MSFQLNALPNFVHIFGIGDHKHTEIGLFFVFHWKMSPVRYLQQLVTLPGLGNRARLSPSLANKAGANSFPVPGNDW